MKPNKQYQLLKYDPALMAVAKSKPNLLAEKIETNSANSKQQAAPGTLAGEIKLPVDATATAEQVSSRSPAASGRKVENKPA